MKSEEKRADEVNFSKADDFLVVDSDLYFSDERVQILLADSRHKLTSFTSNYFQCCITSPPYWGLRDYDYPDQIGAESTVEDYIGHLVSVFREVRRTLREDGTFWLNIGDAYTSGGRTWRAPDKKNPARSMTYRPNTPAGLKPKDLIGLPWRVAFALQQDGWYLRSDIIWNKPNCQPESVKDRPTRCHEYLFLFSKTERYFYDGEKIREPANGSNELKNRRSVWNINTEGFKGAHFAVFPPRLVELCLLAGTSTDSLVLDPFFGSGTVGVMCKRHRRNCIGIEMKPEYAALARQRVRMELEQRNLFF
jgi:site-specific DNA-methyltransferase (cytosine-N4-specific)